MKYRNLKKGALFYSSNSSAPQQNIDAVVRRESWKNHPEIFLPAII
jgi:hypothetical protein